MEWEQIELEEIAVKRGGSVDPSKYKDEIFQLFSIPAFDRGVAEVCRGFEIGSSKKCVTKGDVLLSRIVPHIRRAWVVPKGNGHRQIASGEWIQFRDKRVFSPYLCHYLVSDPFHSMFMRTVSGVGGSLLRARPAEVYKIKLPLPPFEEQKRIARILDAADALRQQRRQALAELDTFLQSTFLHLFGDPVTNPKGWDCCSLKDQGSFKNGLNFGKGEAGHDVHYLGVGDFQVNSRIEGVSSLGKISLNKLPSAEYFLKDGDLLLVRSNGNRALVGRCIAVYPRDYQVTFSGFCIRYRIESNSLVPVYLAHLFRDATFRFSLLSGGQGANIQNINQKALSSIAIPLPPLALQQHFAKIVTKAETQKVRMREQLTELDTLFGALQQRAFNGDL